MVFNPALAGGGGSGGKETVTVTISVVAGYVYYLDSDRVRQKISAGTVKTVEAFHGALVASSLTGAYGEKIAIIDGNSVVAYDDGAVLHVGSGGAN